MRAVMLCPRKRKGKKQLLHPGSLGIQGISGSVLQGPSSFMTTASHTHLGCRA